MYAASLLNLLVYEETTKAYKLRRTAHSVIITSQTAYHMWLIHP